MSEVRHPIGTPVLLKERKSADLSDGHIVTSVGVSVTEIGFIGEAYKSGFDDGYSAREWRYNVVFPNKGIVKRLSNYDLVVTEFEGPEIPEMKKARDVRIGDVLKNQESAKFVVADMGLEYDEAPINSDALIYFSGTMVGTKLSTGLNNIPIGDEVEVYEND